MEVIDDCLVLFRDILSVLWQHFLKSQNTTKKKRWTLGNKKRQVLFKFFEYLCTLYSTQWVLCIPWYSLSWVLCPPLYSTQLKVIRWGPASSVRRPVKRNVHLTNKDMTKDVILINRKDSERFSSRCSVLTCSSWLSSKNDVFPHILDGPYELWYTPIKITRSNRQNYSFSLFTLYVELHFHTLWITSQSSSCSKHESFITNLRKHVVPPHSDWTPGCPVPFTTPHSHFLLFLPPFFKV